MHLTSCTLSHLGSLISLEKKGQKNKIKLKYMWSHKKKTGRRSQTLVHELCVTIATSKFCCCFFYPDRFQVDCVAWHRRFNHRETCSVQEKSCPGCSWHILRRTLLAWVSTVSQLTQITREISLNHLLLSLTLIRYTPTGQETLKQTKYNCHLFHPSYSEVSTNLLCELQAAFLNNNKGIFHVVQSRRRAIFLRLWDESLPPAPAY